VRRKAGEYRRRFGADPDELEAIGLARMPYALRSYKPESGSFLNYFANCAAREMTAYGREVEARRGREVGSVEALDLEPAREDRAGEHDDRVRAALADLDPLGRELLERVEVTDDGEPLGLISLGRKLGISYKQAKRIHREAFNRISDRLAPAVA
jgi:RNA polymerase sigma factor (sigma-70 family)